MSVLWPPRPGPRLSLARRAHPRNTRRASGQLRRRTLRRPSANTLASIGAIPALLALIVLDIVDRAARGWFVAHALTTAAIVSMLVLLVTVLNVDRVARHRQLRDRATVIAAQAAVVNSQARRTTDLARAALDDATQREAAGDELRTYLTMLLISAPTLIDASAARAFLEAAQRLAWLLSVAMQRAADGRAHELDDQLDTAVDAVSAAVTPLMSVLDLDQLAAVDRADGDSAASD